MTYAYGRFALGLLGSTALAFALLPSGTASAQNCGDLSTLQCNLLQDQYPRISSFASLPSTTAGQNLLSNSLAQVVNVYQNATTAQQNNASLVAVGEEQAIIWNALSNMAVSVAGPPVGTSAPALNSYTALNASSFQNGSAGAAFVPFAPIVASTATLATNVTGQAPLYSQIAQLAASVYLPIAQANNLKYSFNSYNTYFLPLGYGTSWAATSTANPASTDLRPFQLTSKISSAPWSSLSPEQQPWAFAVSTQNGSTGQWPEYQTSPAFPSGHSQAGNTTAVLNALLLPQAYQSLMVSGLEWGIGRNVMGVHHPLDVIGSRVLVYYTVAQLLSGTSQLYNNAFATYGPSAAAGQSFSTYVGNLYTQAQAATNAASLYPYQSCASNVAACIANGTFPSSSQLTAANQAYVQLATYGLLGPVPANSATTTAPQYSNLLLGQRFPYLSTQQQLDVLTSTMLPAGVPFDDGTGWARLNLYAAAGGYGAFNNGMVTLTMNASAGGFSAFDFWSNNISGTGGLTLAGNGTLVLGGNNTYTGGTVVAGGTLALSGTMIGSLQVNSGATFVTGGGYTVSPTSFLSNAGTVQSVGVPLQNYGSLTNNGTIAGTVTNYGTMGGSGTVVGNVVNSGVLTPGNSIGTMTVTGNLASSGVYSAEVNAAGQSDVISVGGAATLQGGSVSVYAQPGSTYAPRTTYRILNATSDLSGTFTSVTDPYPFLQTSLSYDVNNVYLNVQMGGFAAAAATPTQIAVGTVLDANVNAASGDFATVLSSMAVNTFSSAQAQATLQAISGNNYAGFSTSMVQGMQLFMNNFANQNGGGGSPMSNRVALAEACDVACDTTSPPKWGAWGGALGGLGTVGAGQPVGTVTYNAGGFAAGLDRLVTDTVRVGVTAGYSTGTQWVGGFDGLGRSNTFQVGLYGGFAQDKLYADGLIGYAYTQNQMWRNIPIPGLQPRTAYGNTGANQWYGQLETGYRFDIVTNANAFVTPFARLQAYTANQNAFTETGAQSLNLSIAQQQTNSLRSVLGAQLGGSMDLGWREKLFAQLRLGWSHEYADVGRPVTATLAGAPAMPFTTWGISPQRDGVVIGLGANTAIAEATSIYLRYEGDISAQDSAHAITAGVRMTW
jgi:autotransporter-associated beta strand protein